MELPSPEVPKKEFEVKISGETLVDPRHPNQDTMKLLPGLIVICDGMGGHPDGDKVSKRAADLLSIEMGEIPEGLTLAETRMRMANAMMAVDHLIRQELPDSGTTATAARFMKVEVRELCFDCSCRRFYGLPFSRRQTDKNYPG